MSEGTPKKKLILCCSSGMSTGLLANKMKDVVEEKSLPLEIDAYSMLDFEEALAIADVILLGPQIKHKESEFRKRVEEEGKLMMVIDSEAYGKINASKVLSDAIKLIKSAM